MNADFRFLIAQLSLAVFGFGVAFHPSVRSMSIASRIAIAFCAGAVALTVEATLFSILGIAWTVLRLGAPLILLSGVCAARWRRLPIETHQSAASGGAFWGWFLPFCALPLLYVLLSFRSSVSTSADYVLFWGVKAVRFANDHGISAELLRNRFSGHAVPDYPPLVPVVQGWGCMLAGDMPWQFAPVMSALWLVAVVPVMLERCRRVLRQGGASVTTGFWTTALSISMAYSLSGGNAEAPLLCFETVALVWLLTETESGGSLFVPAIALAGAALTKVEGSLAVILIAAGTLLQRSPGGIRRSAIRVILLGSAPAAALATWFAYQASQKLPVGYRAHGALLGLHLNQIPGTLSAMLVFLNSGSFWLPWILPVSLLLLSGSRWREAAPALTLAGGLLVFFLFDYLHDAAIPRLRIEWTLPRISQPALSAVILAASLVSLRARGTSRFRGREDERTERGKHDGQGEATPHTPGRCIQS